MYTEALKSIGLTQNEALIYQSLIRFGELSVSGIAAKARVNRRNVYDSIQRLLEKGLVFEILEARESRYQAVDPGKLRELIQEKEQRLLAILPALDAMHQQNQAQESVYIYRGVEGWKNYMRDIVRMGEDVYVIGGKGSWLDPRLAEFTPQFARELERKKIKINHLFDHEVKASQHEIISKVAKNYRFFPQGYSTASCVDIFGDRVNIGSPIFLGGIETDLTITVIVNQPVANAFRTWFRFMWDSREPASSA